MSGENFSTACPGNLSSSLQFEAIISYTPYKHSINTEYALFRFTPMVCVSS